MEKECTTCKYVGISRVLEPCCWCIRNSNSNIAVTDGWQPMNPAQNYGCETCKFQDYDGSMPPCNTCTHSIVGDKEGYTLNWQPARKKRKELKRELSDWKREYNYQQERACKAEEKLAVASDEIESMHRALADKDAIIEEMRKENEELKRELYIDKLFRNTAARLRKGNAAKLNAAIEERDLAMAVCTELDEKYTNLKYVYFTNPWGGLF